MSDPLAGQLTDRETDLEKALERAVVRLEKTSRLMKANNAMGVLEVAGRLLGQEHGVEILYRWAPRMEAAGVFAGTDWAEPQALLPGLVKKTLEDGDRSLAVLECLNQVRMLAIVNGLADLQGFTPEQARHFITQTLVLNLDRVFDSSGQTEAVRERLGGLNDAINRLFRFLADHIGFQDIVGSLVEEIWRVLGQRPIQVNHIKSMITQIAVSFANEDTPFGDASLGADRLISALFGPTHGCQDDPGTQEYRDRLATMDSATLQKEAGGFARAMHDVGLASDYHAVFLRWLLENSHTELIGDALGLSSTGMDSLKCYTDLVHRLIDEAIHPQTAQSVYGLAMLLERGLMYQPPIGPALWRQLELTLSDQAKFILSAVFGTEHPPRVILLAGVITLLGQPLGVGQGNNPTCQSARAISLWALASPDYLVHLIASVARNDKLLMTFEGKSIDSASLKTGSMKTIPLDNDPVSTLLVPHLDRVYHEMGRLCMDREEDPHKWINPEFHGWYVGRSFHIAVDIATGNLKDYDLFLYDFYRSYHPYYNGNQPVIHPQPAGLAVTDSLGKFVGWHAITLLRVAIDQAGVMRVYFYNPNNDSGQNWGNGVTVSTQGNGERFGESSLAFPELASRLYIFHSDPLIPLSSKPLPQDELASVQEMALNSWAETRRPAAQA